MKPGCLAEQQCQFVCQGQFGGGLEEILRESQHELVDGQLYGRLPALHIAAELLQYLQVLLSGALLSKGFKPIAGCSRPKKIFYLGAFEDQ